MPATLDAIRVDLQLVNSKAMALCEGLNPEQLARRGEPGKWSIAENLDHLSKTTEIYLPVIDHALAETRQRELRSEGPFEVGRYGRLLVWYLEPPPVIRLPAPKILKPQSMGPASEALPHFLESQQQMDVRMETAQGFNLTGMRFSSPLASYIKMNLLEFFLVLNSHARRHLWQACNVREKILQPVHTPRL